MKQYRFSTVLLGLAVVIALGGCTVSTHESKGESGKKNEDVDIRTPVGSLTVHSGDVDAKDTGLSVYPGARVTTTSFFGVKVVAVKFASDDSPDKILAFYRKDMARYGNLIECDTKTVSFHPRKHDPDAPVRCEGDGGMRNIKELKAGVESNQHVVAVQPKGSGSEFSLVFVRLRDSKDTI